MITGGPRPHELCCGCVRKWARARSHARMRVAGAVDDLRSPRGLLQRTTARGDERPCLPMSPNFREGRTKQRKAQVPIRNCSKKRSFYSPCSNNACEKFRNGARTSVGGTPAAFDGAVSFASIVALVCLYSRSLLLASARSTAHPVSRQPVGQLGEHQTQWREKGALRELPVRVLAPAGQWQELFVGNDIKIYILD